MSYRDRVNAAVQTIGTQLGKSLALDEHGTLTLEFAGGRLCWLEASEADSRVVMSAPVAAAHGEARTAMFEAALQANLHSPRTDHGIVGFDQDGQQLVLMGTFGGDMDAERLAAAISAFLQSALALAEKLDEVTRSYRPAAAEALPSDHDLHFKV